MKLQRYNVCCMAFCFFTLLFNFFMHLCVCIRHFSKEVLQRYMGYQKGRGASIVSQIYMGLFKSVPEGYRGPHKHNFLYRGPEMEMRSQKAKRFSIGSQIHIGLLVLEAPKRSRILEGSRGTQKHILIFRGGNFNWGPKVKV